mmetsp:Transcript_15592/g.28352  ORF Transcript_15592/g.28352 Transcript_15592/m.28352 type:complete len:283 (+) Transcript_15592:328-1176(+)
MPRTMPVKHEFEEQISEIKKDPGMSVVSTDTCITRPIMMDEIESFEPSLSLHDQVRQESPLKSLVSPAESTKGATLQSYQRVVESLEEEVSALRQSLEIQRQSESSRIKLELNRMADKHRRELDALKRSYEKESKVKQDAIMSALSSKYDSDLKSLKLSYEYKLNQMGGSKSSTGLLSNFEQNVVKGKTSDRYEEKPSLTLLDEGSKLTMEVEDSEIFNSILLGKDDYDEDEKVLVKENKKLREALSTALNHTGGMCSRCKKLASASQTLDSHVSAFKYLLE